MCRFIKKSVSYCLSAILAFSLVLLGVSNTFAKDSVTERELLMLAALSYSNKQEENVCDMTKDEEFNKKWFCGYGDASELVGWKTVDASIAKGNDNQESFSAVCYKKGDNLVIAFRGTDDGIVSENWNYILPYTEHPQVKPLREYIKRLTSAEFIDSETKIYCTGHSLGGYLTLYGTGVILETYYLKDKFVRSATFNGLGLGFVKDMQIVKILSNLDKSQLTNYRIYGDVVSTMGIHFTKMKTFKLLKEENTGGFDVKRLKNAHCPHHFLAHSEFGLK